MDVKSMVGQKREELSWNRLPPERQAGIVEV